LAGQAGIKDHISIGDGAVVLAQAGLFGDVAPGEVVSGYPARPHRERLRQDAAAANLPEYVKRIRALEKSNAELTARNERLERLVSLLMEKLETRE
jgi:UDP-3-O-[3-hydroxymyristoyl] glucosamine N-acyltransferase